MKRPPRSAAGISRSTKGPSVASSQPNKPGPDDDEEPLSPAFRRELERRLRDISDPRRYIVASAFFKHFVLYYNVLENAYGMNDLSYGTAFKSLRVAQAVCKAMGAGNTVIQVRRTKSGAVRRITSLEQAVRASKTPRKTRKRKRPGSGA
jgi:hypothetical protein